MPNVRFALHAPTLRPTRCLGHRYPLGVVLLTALLLAAAPPGDAPMTLVPEMEVPPGIEAARPSARKQLADHSEAQRGLDALRAEVQALWPHIRNVDFTTLARHHVAETRGWQPPADPGPLTGDVLGRSADGNHWFLTLRGPRLPARYDAVHRRVAIYARYGTHTGTLDRLSLSIYTEVFE